MASSGSSRSSATSGDFARLDETDRFVVDLERGHLLDVSQHHRRPCCKKQRRPRFVVDARVLSPCSAIPGKINQVVMNLLANAIDACEPGGQVTFRTCEAVAAVPQNDIGGEPAPGGIEIHVIDNGRGIDPEVRDRIFDAFFTTKPQGKGTGLGPARSCRREVHTHQGRINVESTPGQGTRFSVFLPRAPVETPRSPAEPIPSAPAAPRAGDA